MISFSVLGSGSKGNAVYVETAQTAVLIDCGFSGKETACRLESIGRDMAKLEAILLTHEHNDHVAGVGVLARRYKIPVYANAGTFLGAENKIGKIEEPVEFETGSSFTIKDLAVKPFRISHDTRDPVGYVLESGNSRFGYCTDTGKVTHLMTQRLQGCHGLVLEFNHDPQMLRNGPYPLALQQRVKSSQGHLSNQQAVEFLDKVHHRDLACVVLAHLSETNNLPDYAIADIESNRKKYGKTEFHIASQQQATRLVTV